MVNPPRLRGRALTAARIAAETKGTNAAVEAIMRAGLRFDILSKLPAEARGELLTQAKPFRARKEARIAHGAGLPAPAVRAWPRSSIAYVEAFRALRLTPREVLERALLALDDLARRTPTMNLLISEDVARARREADASTARYARGAALGPLDGVPTLIKDEFDVAGLPTTLGSRCGDQSPRERDSTVVARLSAAGCVMAGKTVLTEWGMSPIGGNFVSQRPIPHNAHHPDHAPGGSSTGSGVGVAMGVAPIAAGGDGGGSIRIPASLNGVFGIKPTFGRVSRAGDGFKGSVAHAGPIAASPLDLALFLDAVASSHDEDDDLTDWAPPPPEGGFGSLLGAGVRGLRIGVDDDEWRDASESVARAGRDALRVLEKEGATIHSVRMPIARTAAQIGYLSIGPESLAAHLHEVTTQRELMADDLRVAFSVLARMSAVEMLDAQRLRTGLRSEAQRVLREVDVIALPTTAITAPRYDREDEQSSFSDAMAIAGLCRFAFFGNLTGLPAGTAPVGEDANGLPIGLQIVGDAWDEACVLSVLAHLERVEIAVPKKPRGAIDLLA
jgi:aspartyl-tRNA(Asn)/glutamyl-tRNA(Gln) amidotransferase subunit A